MPLDQKITFRMADWDSDHSDLLSLAYKLGIPARVKIGIDRSPDFRAFNRAIGIDTHAVVAEIENKLIGFLELTPYEISVFGKPWKGYHLPLGGVSPQFRNKGIFRSIFQRGIDHAKKDKAHFAFTLINAGNHVVKMCVQNIFPEAIYFPKLMVHGIVGRTPSPFSSKSTTHFTQVSNPIPVLQNNLKGYDLIPGLESQYVHLQAEPNATYYQSREVGLGIWSPYKYKRTVLSSYGFMEHMLILPLNALMFFQKRPAFPSPGNALKAAYFYGIRGASEFEDTFLDLLDFTIKNHTDYHIFFLAIPESSNLNNALKKYMRFVNINIPTLVPLSDEFAVFLKENKPKTMFCEYAFI